MKTKTVKPKYQAWLSSETMHKGSIKWLSELEFTKDEQLFFNDLVKSYTLQLIDSKYFSQSQKIIEELRKLEKQNKTLLEKIKKHEAGLLIMVDGVNQVEKENAYKEEHAKLIITVNKFLKRYKILKTQLFSLIKGIIKEGKQKRLIQ
jgi:hypothetical protein